MKQPVEDLAGALGRTGQLVAFLDLSENLRLAHDHAVQARRHQQQVPHGVLVLVEIQAGFELLRLHADESRPETPTSRPAICCAVLLARVVQLDPVAGREQDELGRTVHLLEPAQRRRRFGRVERQPLPNLHGCALMIQAENDNAHLELK